MILADSNVLSETSKLVPDPRALEWVEANEVQLYVPTVVLAELRYGCEKLPASAKRRELEAWLSALIVRYDQKILPFARESAEAHGVLRARLKSLGKPASAPDSYIAAMALALDVPVATRNVKHFEWTGARLINPWEA